MSSESYATADPGDSGDTQLRTLEEYREREYHERIKIDSTVKDGYRVSEIVIACDYTGIGPDPYDYTYRMHQLHEAGQRVCDELNAEFGKPGLRGTS